MPHTDHNKRHNHNGAISPENIHENLEYRLPIVTSKGSIEILNREQKTQNNEESEDG